MSLRIGIVFALILQLNAGAEHSRLNLVELFTSEGCSSCPPADKVLSILAEREDVAVLSWHVNYWDYIGWVDPYGHPEATPRQRAYGRTFRRSSIYTPQMVVNGRTEFVGSDQARADRVLKSQPANPAVIELTAKMSEGSISVSALISNSGKNTHAYLALTEDNLVSNVKRGENRSRTLNHDGIVRKYFDLGALINGSKQLEREIKVIEKWKRKDLKIVIWVQNTSNMKIEGVAKVTPMRK